VEKIEVRKKGQKIITYYEVIYNGNLFKVKEIEDINKKMITYDVRKEETQNERVNIIKEISSL